MQSFLYFITNHKYEIIIEQNTIIHEYLLQLNLRFFLLKKSFFFSQLKQIVHFPKINKRNIISTALCNSSKTTRRLENCREKENFLRAPRTHIFFWIRDKYINDRVTVYCYSTIQIRHMRSPRSGTNTIFMLVF